MTQEKMMHVLVKVFVKWGREAILAIQRGTLAYGVVCGNNYQSFVLDGAG